MMARCSVHGEMERKLICNMPTDLIPVKGLLKAVEDQIKRRSGVFWD